MNVGVEQAGKLELVPPKPADPHSRSIPSHLRPHLRFSGHERGAAATRGGGHPQRRASQSAEQIERLAALPLLRHPGEAFEYGLSTDVLGRVIEVVAGVWLGEVLRGRSCEPLGMIDTAFFTPPAKRARLAEPFSYDVCQDQRRST